MPCIRKGKYEQDKFLYRHRGKFDVQHIIIIISIEYRTVLEFGDEKKF